jgi:hypothetical protein
VGKRVAVSVTVAVSVGTGVADGSGVGVTVGKRVAVSVTVAVSVGTATVVDMGDPPDIASSALGVTFGSASRVAVTNAVAAASSVACSAVGAVGVGNSGAGPTRIPDVGVGSGLFGPSDPAACVAVKVASWTNVVAVAAGVSTGRNAIRAIGVEVGPSIEGRPRMPYPTSAMMKPTSSSNSSAYLPKS